MRSVKGILAGNVAFSRDFGITKFVSFNVLQNFHVIRNAFLMYWTSSFCPQNRIMIQTNTAFGIQDMSRMSRLYS